MNDKLSRQNCVLYVCGIIPVVWLALLAAPLLEGGLGTLLEGFGTALENPFHIVWCDKSLKTLLIFLMLYGLGIGIYAPFVLGKRKHDGQNQITCKRVFNKSHMVNPEKRYKSVLYLMEAL